MTANTVSRRIALIALAIGAAVSGSQAAGASTRVAETIAQPHVLVPHQPAPAPKMRVSGCWEAQRRIYGPYAFSFCSNGSYGSYQVRGGGLFCDGSVNISRGPGNAVTINLSRTPCNGWTDWSADRLVCRSGGRDMPMTRVAVPAPPARLDCTYFPSVPGYHPIGLALSPS